MSDGISPSEFRNGTLVKIKTLALDQLTPGDYRLLVHLRAEGSQEVLASAVEPFRIGERNAEPALYLLSNFRGASRNGVAAYVRGLESMARNDTAAAVRNMEESLAQNPANTFAGLNLIQLYFGTSRYAEVGKVYSRVGIAAVKSSPEAMAQVALAFAQTGDAAGARRLLDTARGYFPQNPVLVAAARSLEQRK
jgi:hypothetical protein